MGTLESIMSQYSCNTANMILERKGSRYYSLALVIDGENVPIGSPVIVKATNGKYHVLSSSDAFKVLSLVGD